MFVLLGTRRLLALGTALPFGRLLRAVIFVKSAAGPGLEPGSSGSEPDETTIAQPRNVSNLKQKQTFFNFQ